MVKKVVTNNGISNKRNRRKHWSAEEDQKLIEYVNIHGDQSWSHVPIQTGLNRCRKSCRLRWKNYLAPNIRKGNITEDEEDLIIRLHNLVGSRWSLIANRLAGRTDNEIKNHWYNYLRKKSLTIDELNVKMNIGLEIFMTKAITSTSGSSSLNKFLNEDLSIGNTPRLFLGDEDLWMLL